MRKKSVQEFIWVMIFLAVFGLVILSNMPDLGSKHPEDEQVTFTMQRNLATGELQNTETVRCRYCHAVISFVQFDHTGKPITGYMRSTHRCGYRWGSHEPYAGLDFGPRHFNFWKWLDSWQKRLSHP